MKLKEIRKELYNIFKIIDIKKENRDLKKQLANEILNNDNLINERDFYKTNYENINDKYIKLKKKYDESKEKKEE